MYYIGYLLEIDESSVADEHLITGTADYVLTRLQFRLEQDKQQIERKKQVMIFCVESEDISYQTEQKSFGIHQR